ncbi:MAG: metallophosphoesterase, partial [Myxococcales bacterium]|nr:metallophosphoesterase [Myxococcales bacterium]
MDTLRSIGAEGFRQVVHLAGVDAIDDATFARRRLDCDRPELAGPFDIIGDIHGCADELEALLDALGYDADGRHPDGRRALFLGDLVDRGPDVPGVLRRVLRATREGDALCLLGNHEAKLVRWLEGRQVRPTHGLAASIEQLEREPDAFRAEVHDFLRSLPDHLVLDGGALVVAHAGLIERLHGRSSKR